MEQQIDTVQAVSKKTDEVQARLKECAHCKGTGTCRNGEKESSCERCVREDLKWKFLFSFSRMRYGMVCSVCGGLGEVEPLTERLNNRIESVLAMFLVYFALIMTWSMASKDNKHFPEILAFSSTIIGSITGYYFGGKKK